MTPAPEAPPIEQQQDYSQQYGENNRELPKQLQDLVAGTIKEFQKQDTYLRRREVMRDRKARFYERGYQHLAWTGGNSGGFALVTPGMQVAGSAAQAPQYVDDYDIFWPYERIQLSILTQNPPGVDFQPDSEREEDTEAANTAEGYTKIFDRNNNIKQIQISALRFMMLGGRTISWTRTEQNGQKYGYNDDGSEKSVEVTTEFGTLESRVPIMAKCQDDALFCFLYDDPQVKKAKSEYPWLAEKIKGNQVGLGENMYERLARLGALQGNRQPMGTGESFSYLTTRLHCWLRPACFVGTDYDAPFEEDPSMTCGEVLTQMFPDGACFKYIGETYIESYAESMDDHLDIAFAFEGDGMFRKAPMDSQIVNQDAFNDAMNATRLIFDVGWPRRYINCSQQDFDAMTGQTAVPYANTQLKLPAGTRIQDAVLQEQQPETPATFEQYKEFIQGPLPQFQTATPPALWGAQMGEAGKTAHGYAQAQQSAMGQLGMLWGVIQHHFAKIRYQSALCASTNPDYAEQIVIPGEGNQTTSLQLVNITKGKFRCYPDEDSSFPETTAAKRQTLTQVLEMLVQAQSPLAAQLLNSPDNVADFLRTFGLAELTLPEAEARDAQQFEIEELIVQSPLPPSPMAIEQSQIQHAQSAMADPMSAQPFDPSSVPPDEPSIPINDYDYHQWHAMKCQDWLNGDECRKQLAKGNQAGVLNVELHWKKHVEAMAAMMPPPMAPGAPGAPPPAAGPPPAPGGPPSPSAATPPTLGPPAITM